MNCMDQRVSFSPQPSTEKENDECSEGSDKYKISDPPSPTPPEDPSSKPYRMDNEKGFVTVNFPIPELCVGLVIGKGGAEVHAINEKTGCRLQVSTEPSPIGYRNVEIHGLPENIDAARECISQVLNRIHHSPPAPHSGAQRQEGETVKTVTVEIPIPAHKCGAVIGRGGDTMQKLRSWSNCQIQLIQENSMPTTTKPLRITGDQQSVEYAQRLVAEVLAKNEGPPPPKHEAPSAPPQETYYENKSLHVKVPRSSVGAIMGPQGMNIKRLSDQTCTSIHVLPEEDPKVMERLITIVGSPDKVYLAADVIRTIITSCNSPDYYVHNVYYMDVPAAKCGLVIGKGGDVIKQINADSGARCELARETKMDAHFKTFVLRGTDLQIEHAKHLIYTKVGDIPPNTPFVPKHRPNANPMQIPSLMNPVHPTQQQQLQVRPQVQAQMQAQIQAHMQARHQMQARSPQQQNTLTNVQMWAGAPIIQNQHPQHPQTQILQNQLHHQQQQQIQQQQFQQHQQVQYQQQQLQQQRQFQQQKFQQIQQQQMAMFPQQNQNFPVMHPPMQGQQNPNWFRMMQQQQQNQQGQPIYPNQGPPYQQAPLQQMQNQMRNSPRQQNNSYQPQPSPQKPQASPQHLPKARNTPKPAATASTTPKEGGSSKSPAKAKEPAKATNGNGSTENKEDGAKKEAKENNSESEEGEGERDYSEQWYQYYLSMNEPEAAENVRKRIEEMKLEKAEKAQASVSRR